MKSKLVTIGGVSYTLNYNIGEDGKATCESLLDADNKDCKGDVDQAELEEM